MGDYFYLGVYFKALVFCQDLSIVYTTLLKITPWLNGRRGRGDSLAILLEDGGDG